MNMLMKQFLLSALRHGATVFAGVLITLGLSEPCSAEVSQWFANNMAAVISGGGLGVLVTAISTNRSMKLGA